MTVLLTVSEAFLGSGYADSLAGGGSGIDLGSVINGSYTPLVDQPTNDGAQQVFVRHNATVDPITDVKTFIQQYSQTYGGADTPANDLATLIAKGQASSSSDANNDDGLASGLHTEMQWNVSQSNQFLPSRIGSQVRIYGDAGTDGISLASAFDVIAAAMVKNNAGSEAAPSAPVLGTIGKSGNTVLGEAAHLRLRFFLEQAASTGGIVQWDWVIAYSFTA
jgi:hypothetical protein